MGKQITSRMSAKRHALILFLAMPNPIPLLDHERLENALIVQ